MTLTNSFTYVFARPGDLTSIIDYVVPGSDPQISAVNGETLAQVRERYPTAEIVPWQDWRALKIAEQQTRVTWKEVTKHRYNKMLEILPPALWNANGFLVGEPWDHCMATGAPRFAAFVVRGSDSCGHGSYEASRPMTAKEFKAVTFG